MIDEKRVIKKLQSRIDDFVLKHPDKKASEAVETIKEFIHLLEEEAKEQGSGWISCSERLPKEYDTLMKRLKGSQRWKSFMWEKQSETVLVTCMLENGERYVRTSRLHDGKWYLGSEIMKRKEESVIAWKPLPEPYNESEV